MILHIMDINWSESTKEIPIDTVEEALEYIEKHNIKHYYLVEVTVVLASPPPI